MALKDKFSTCINTAYTHVENDGSYAMTREGNALTLIFEWSNGKLDWYHNIMFPAKPYRNMENLWFCHRGFLKVWKSIEPYIKDAIMDETVDHIDIIGYSHGAAIAQLCFEYVKFNRPEVAVTGVGFGAPRVFWGIANQKVLDRFKDFVVVKNGRDIVTHLPPVLFGFHHVATVLKIGDSVGLIKDHDGANYWKYLCELYEKENI